MGSVRVGSTLLKLGISYRNAKELLHTLEGKANLVSGQNSQDGSKYSERIGLRCYPIGKTGTIGVHVTLTDYPYTDCRLEEIFKISGEIKTEIQLFDEFLNQLLSLLSGTAELALLRGIE